MPARAMKRTATEDAASALLLVAADPKKYQKRLDELADRRATVEEAEAVLAERIKAVESRESAVNIGLERVQTTDVRLDQRQREVGNGEVALSEKTEIMEGREAAVEAREVAVQQREDRLEGERLNALTAVRALLLSDLETAE